MLQKYCSYHLGITDRGDTVTSQQEHSGLYSQVFLCGLCMSSLYLNGFSPGTLAPSHGPKNMQGGCVNWVLEIGHRCEWLFISICQPCGELATCLGCTPPLPNDSVISCTTTTTLLRNSGRKWMHELPFIYTIIQYLDFHAQRYLDN